MHCAGGDLLNLVLRLSEMRASPQLLDFTSSDFTVSLFYFSKKKPPGPDSIQARRPGKNVVVLCILVRALHPMLLIVLRVHLVQKTFSDNSRKFKFVKYTKTLLMRNLHDTISHAFFRYKRCNAR